MQPFRRCTFYRDNKSLPVYEWNSPLHTYNVTDIAQAILTISTDDSRIFHRAPTNVEHNCTFLIDQSKLRSPADIKADDSGSWKNNGVCNVVILISNSDVSIVARGKDIKNNRLSKNIYSHEVTTFIKPVKILEK